MTLTKYFVPCLLAACHQGSLPTMVIDDAWMSVEAFPRFRRWEWSPKVASCYRGLLPGSVISLYQPVACARFEEGTDTWELRVYAPEDLDDATWLTLATPDRTANIPSNGYTRVAPGLGLQCLPSEAGPPAFFLYMDPDLAPLESVTTRCRLPDGTELGVRLDVVRLPAMPGGARDAIVLDRATRRALSGPRRESGMLAVREVVYSLPATSEPAPAVVREDDLARIVALDRDVRYEITPMGLGACHGDATFSGETKWVSYGPFGCSRQEVDGSWTFRVYVPVDVAEEQWSVWYDHPDSWRRPIGQVWEEQVSPGLYLRCSQDRSFQPLFELQHLPTLATGPLAGGTVTCRVPSLGEVAATVEVVLLDRRPGGRRRFLELEKGRRRFEQELDGTMTP